ncbi:MAG: N-glycosylase, partial [Candidatus Lokiarchaeota archaeon]|nr:N-glycosylase [Candidatus Lokiarchaeota archaeon]MBD3340703.1 N-glycosylase [Candidatus Lokiarchaeota archaeon]
MDKLIAAIKKLKKNDIRSIVENKIKEFEVIKSNAPENIFIELCFCIMTANCGAEKCIEVHENIGKDFLSLDQDQLASRFKELGYRFPNIRSKYIVEAREKTSDLFSLIKEYDDEEELREWIVKNIKGIGYKEGSHFLRNIGFKNYAIIDFHIVDLLT